MNKVHCGKCWIYQFAPICLLYSPIYYFHLDEWQIHISIQILKYYILHLIEYSSTNCLPRCSDYHRCNFSLSRLSNFFWWRFKTNFFSSITERLIDIFNTTHLKVVDASKFSIVVLKSFFITLIDFYLLLISSSYISR